MSFVERLRERADYEERGGKGTEFEVSAKFTADMMRNAADRIEAAEETKMVLVARIKAWGDSAADLEMLRGDLLVPGIPIELYTPVKTSESV